MQAFKENHEFRLEQPPLPEELHKRGSPFSQLHGSRPAGRSPEMANAGPRTSIYVGNLPVTASQVDLRRILNQYGEIKNIEIVSRVSMFHCKLLLTPCGLDRQLIFTAGTVNVFAFVEFETEEGARRASAPERNVSCPSPCETGVAHLPAAPPPWHPPSRGAS